MQTNLSEKNHRCRKIPYLLFLLNAFLASVLVFLIKNSSDKQPQQEAETSTENFQSPVKETLENQNNTTREEENNLQEAEAPLDESSPIDQATTNPAPKPAPLAPKQVSTPAPAPDTKTKTS
jgi:hypothetical protein